MKLAPGRSDNSLIRAAQDDDAALERLSAQRASEQCADDDEQHARHDHRIEKVRPPEGEARHQEEQQGLQDHAQRDGHRKARRGKAQRQERGDAIRADGDERDLQREDEHEQLRQARRHRLDRHVDLMGPHDPADLGRREQQKRVHDPEQQDRVRYVMLEQPQHGRRVPDRPRSPGRCKDIRHVPVVSHQMTKKG